MPPIKRSTQLAPLSREHHEGLLLAWKIRQGLAKGIDAKRISDYLQWFWEGNLEEHFRREEAAFFPALGQAPLLLRMQGEHQEIEGLLHVNAQIADNALLEEIAEKLNDHIRFEERVLFPWIEEQLNPAALDALSTMLEPSEKKERTWADAFWER